MTMEKVTRLSIILAALLGLTGFARAQVIVRGPLAFDHDVHAGDSVRQEFVIENAGDSVMTATVYQTDYAFSSDGTNTYGAPGSVARSNAPWIRFSPSVLRLAPGMRATVQYEVTVPDSAAGSFWSILMVEGQPGDLLDDDADRAEGVGVRQRTRYGVQVATHIRGSGSPALEFAEGALESGPDGPMLRIDLVNTGDRMLRPDLSLRIVDAAGHEYGPFQAAPRRLYPGTSVRQAIALRDIPPGRYAAILVADGGDDAVFGLELDLNL